jgi:hypothetical protein
MSKLSKNEKELFHALTNPEYINFALLRAEYKGKDCACIVSLHRHKTHRILIKPCAIVMTDELAKDLTLEGKSLPT